MQSIDEETDERSTLSEQLNQSGLAGSSTLQEAISQNHFLHDFAQRMMGRYYTEKRKAVDLEERLNAAQVELDRHKELLRLTEEKLRTLTSTCGNSDFRLALQRLKSELQTVANTEKSTVDDRVQELETAGEKLCRESQFYKEEFESMMKDALTSMKCRNCKKTFIPKTNLPTSCLYHPGKLHYYSCLGCGDDAYYTCCNRCSNCSPGCRTGSHVGL